MTQIRTEQYDVGMYDPDSSDDSGGGEEVDDKGGEGEEVEVEVEEYEPCGAVQVRRRLVHTVLALLRTCTHRRLLSRLAIGLLSAPTVTL